MIFEQVGRGGFAARAVLGGEGITNRARDVSVAECGRGLQVVLVGVVPEFRGVLESLYFFLILKNGWQLISIPLTGSSYYFKRVKHRGCHDKQPDHRTCRQVRR